MSGRYYRRRSYYNRWNRGGRYYGRNRYYSSSNRRSNGQIRAARSQSDQGTFTINVPTTISAFNKPSNTYTNEEVADGKLGVYALNIFDLLRKSEFYQNYASMYDEFKIDKIKVKLIPSNFAVNYANGKYIYRNLTVYTAWDRTGLSDGQYSLLVLNDYIKSENVEENTWYIGTSQGTTSATAEGVKNFGGLYCIIGDDITTYSSAESRVISPNTNSTITRWLNPKTIDEKGQWLSTSSLKAWSEGYDAAKGRYYNIIVSDQLGKFNDVNLDAVEQLVNISDGNNVAQATVKGLLLNFESPLASDNPCSLIEDQGLKFKPTLLIGVFPSDSNSIQVPGITGEQTIPSNQITFNVEAEVVLTFRGLRKAKVVAA